MNKQLLTAGMSLLGITLLSTQAMACPNGYKRVWIQGNPVCMLDAAASNNLTAKPSKPPFGQVQGAKKTKRLRTNNR